MILTPVKKGKKRGPVTSSPSTGGEEQSMQKGKAAPGRALVMWRTKKKDGRGMALLREKK